MKENGHEISLNELLNTEETGQLLDVLFEDGETKTMEIIAQFDNMNTGKSYILLADAEGDEIDELFMYRIEDSGEDSLTLSNDLTDEEFELGKRIVDELWSEVEGEDNE
jgi:uncharacterized protein YrzB (UPF0473 family)